MKSNSSTERKISSSEIEQLYDFTKQHYVEYYDLQTELVDHLANGIEERWHKNPKLSFKEGLDLEFNKFGIFGFADVIKEREKAMNKRYIKIIWKEIKKQFKQPLILIGIAIFMAVTTYFRNGIVFTVLCILLLLQSIYFLIRTRKIRRKSKKRKRIYLLEKIIMQSSGANMFLLYIIMAQQFPLSLETAKQISVYGAILWGAAFCLLFILNYIILYILPQKKEVILADMFPKREYV